MKKFLKIKNFLLGTTLLLLLGLAYILFTDDYTQAKFRTMQDPIASSKKVDLNGLREIQASGGPMVNFPDLSKKLNGKNKNIVILDGMWEYHGYIKGIPTTYFGYQKKDLDLRYLLRRLLFTGTTDIRRDLVTSEPDMAKSYGYDYRNIKIDSKALTTDKAVDEFVAFVDTLPPDTWVHFHCRLGKGRTSMMLVMFDTMRNAPQVALKDIIKRQRILGSENLANTISKKGGTYTSETLTNRKRFIESFYDFICQRKAGGIQRWSEWNHLRQATVKGHS
jgi:hypothetical protein